MNEYVVTVHYSNADGEFEGDEITTEQHVVFAVNAQVAIFRLGAELMEMSAFVMPSLEKAFNATVRGVVNIIVEEC